LQISVKDLAQITIMMKFRLKENDRENELN
jgi:hypothetical protein